MLASDTHSTRKKDVVARAGPNEVIYQVWKGRYFAVCDYDTLLLILRNTRHPKIHEYVRRTQAVNLFFDIDFDHAFSVSDVQDPSAQSITRANIIQAIEAKIQPFLSTFTYRKVILSSHTTGKTSFHVIFKLFQSGEHVMIANRRWIRKNVYDKFKLDELKDGAGRSIVDPMVYNDGTLRTYLSCKSSKPYRPFQFEAGSEHESELESFIGYSFPGGYDITIGRVDEESVRDREASQSTTLEPEQDRAIREFVSKKFMVPTDRITATMRLGTSDPQVYIADFKDTPCKIADREHKSNCQYVVIGPKKATYKCRDVADCSQKKDERLTISFAEYTDGLKQMLMKPGPDLKAEMKALIRKRTNDSPSGSPIYDLEQGSLSMAESSLSTFYDENDPGTHIMTPKAYKLRRLNSTTKFNGSIEEAPLIMKHITINKHYYGAVEESAYNLKLPFGLFDPTLSDLWERALGLTGEDTLAKIFSRDEKEVVYSAGSYYCFTGSV